MALKFVRNNYFGACRNPIIPFGNFAQLLQIYFRSLSRRDDVRQTRKVLRRPNNLTGPCAHLELCSS